MTMKRERKIFSKMYRRDFLTFWLLTVSKASLDMEIWHREKYRFRKNKVIILCGFDGIALRKNQILGEINEIFSWSHSIETTPNEFHFGLADCYEFIVCGFDGITSRVKYIVSGETKCNHVNSL